MLSFILKRVLATVPVMGVVALTVFLLLRLSPGDPAATWEAAGATWLLTGFGSQPRFSEVAAAIEAGPAD